MVGLEPAEDPSRKSSSQITRNLRAWQRTEESKLMSAVPENERCSGKVSPGSAESDPRSHLRSQEHVLEAGFWREQA